MQRQKTAEEFEQERRDEEFARQLQEQLDAEERRQQQQQPQVSPRPVAQSGYPAASQPHRGGAGQLQRVVCPMCQTVNEVELRPGQRAQCGTCTTIFVPQLPVTSSPPRGPVAAPHHHPHSSLVTCQNCRSHNEIPTGHASAMKFMCGHCYRILTFNQPPQVIQQQQQQAQQQFYQQQYTTQQPPAVQPAVPPPPQEEVVSSQVYQGSVVKRLQVRCGECDTVNQVRANPRDTVVKFSCSNCQQENEVELSS